MGMKKLLTIRELAEVSGLSVSTLRRLKAKNRIPYFQPGGHRSSLRFPTDAIAATSSASCDGGKKTNALPIPMEEPASGSETVAELPMSTLPAVEPPRRYGPSPRWMSGRRANEPGEPHA